MSTFAISRRALSLGAAAALLAGCGGSQAPLGPSPDVMAAPQSIGSAAYTILYEFGKTPEDGTNPDAGLIVVKGTLYGTTIAGGSNNVGTVFSITKTGQETVLHSFGSSGDGSEPTAALLDVGGTLYGTTSEGGANNSGTVFSITRGGTEKVLYSFPFSANGGSYPYASLIDVNGTLYGTTYQGGNPSCGSGGCGSIFSITTGGTEHLLYSFGGASNDGLNPQAALLNVDGTLYGTTSQGGKNKRGTVFTVSTRGKEHVLYSFGADFINDGYQPTSALVAAGGVLYGTTEHGPRDYYSGTVFCITKFGREHLVYSFNGSDGSQPIAGLVNIKGVLYGTTFMGGVKNVGSVFSVTTAGQETVLHSFSAGSGKNPIAGLAVADGALYGTTYGSFVQHHGNVFSITP